jgi:hypothetical protein
MMARSQNDYKTANSSMQRPAIQDLPSECHVVAQCRFTFTFNFMYGHKKSMELAAPNFRKLINAQ